MIIRQTKTRYIPGSRSPAPFPPSFFPIHLEIHSRSSPIFPPSLLFLKRCGIVPLLPTNHREYHFLRVVDRCPDPEISIFHIQGFFFSLIRSPPSLLTPPLLPRYLFMLDFSNLEERERESIKINTVGRFSLAQFVTSQFQLRAARRLL